MEEAMLRNEYDMQQRVDEKHQQFEAFKNDVEFEAAEVRRLKKHKKDTAEKFASDLAEQCASNAEVRRKEIE